MSVINKMLKDLEQRQQSSNEAMSPLVEESKSNKLVYLVIAGIFLLLAGVTWFYLAQFQPESPALPQAEHKAEPELSTPLQQATEAVAIAEQAQQQSASASDTSNSATAASDAAKSSEVAIAPIAAAETRVAAAEPVAATSTSTDSTGSPVYSQAQAGQTDKSPAPETELSATAPKTKQAQVQQAKPAVPSSGKAEEKTTAAKPAAAGSAKNTSESTESVLQVTKLEMSREERVAMYTRRGFSAMEKGEPRKARQEFTKALKLDAHAHDAREQLAALQFGAGYQKEALNLLEQGIELDPDYPAFRMMAARIAIKQENLQQAYYYLERLSLPVEENLDYYATFAGLSQQLGYLEGAATTYDKLVKAEPNRARWWFGFAVAVDQMAYSAEALFAYQQAVVLGQLSQHSKRYAEQRIAALEQN